VRRSLAPVADRELGSLARLGGRELDLRREQDRALERDLDRERGRKARLERGDRVPR
jgi:hypothetical protein